MIFYDEIDKSELDEWFAETLDRHHICRYSQLTCMTQKELLDSGISTGTVRHIYLLLVSKGLSLRDGDNCLCRLGLKYKNLNRLRECFIDTLDDLEKWSVDDLIKVCGLSFDMAYFVERRMNMLGRALAN